MIEDDDETGEVQLRFGGKIYRATYDIADGYIYLHVEGYGTRPAAKLLPGKSFEGNARYFLREFINTLKLAGK